MIPNATFYTTAMPPNPFAPVASPWSQLQTAADQLETSLARAVQTLATQPEPCTDFRVLNTAATALKNMVAARRALLAAQADYQASLPGDGINEDYLDFLYDRYLRRQNLEQSPSSPDDSADEQPCDASAEEIPDDDPAMDLPAPENPRPGLMACHGTRHHPPIGVRSSLRGILSSPNPTGRTPLSYP